MTSRMGATLHIRPTVHRLSFLPSSPLSGPMPHLMTRWPLRYVISDSVRSVALKDGQSVSHAAIYPNYALFGTPLEDMYGGNVERLRRIRAMIDPGDVMGLTGGWRF
jgi:hypothetical protein